MYLEMIDDGAMEWIEKVCDAPDLTSNAERIRFLTKKLAQYGFYLIGSGTNRVVYCLHGTKTDEGDICFKIALDSRGRKDNLQEYNLYAEAPAPIIEKKYFIEVFELSDDCLVAVERKVDHVMDMYTAKLKKTDREKMFRDLDEFYLLDDASPYANCGVVIEHDDSGKEIQRVCMIDYANFVKKENLHLFCTSDECDGIEDESTYLVYNSSLTGMVCPRCNKTYSFADIKGTGKSEYTDREAMMEFMGTVQNIQKNPKLVRREGDINDIILDEIHDIYQTGLMFSDRVRLEKEDPYDSIGDSYEELMSDISESVKEQEEKDYNEFVKSEQQSKSQFANNRRMSDTEIMADIREMQIDSVLEDSGDDNSVEEDIFTSTFNSKLNGFGF